MTLLKAEGVAARESDRSYFPHVEGLRGVAALYVFLYHARENALSLPSGLSQFAGVTGFLGFGHFSVAVFIVISGYCLGLPVARRHVTIDARRFAVRRLRRLYPAYALAVLLSVPVALIYVLHGKAPLGQFAVDLVSHLFLVHNLQLRTAFSLNVPLWSIGLEVQIYIIFALLLVPIWRRFGVLAQLAIALVIGLVPNVFLHGALSWTCPWFVGLFAMGICAAQWTVARTLTGMSYQLVAAIFAFTLMGQAPGTNFAPTNPWQFVAPDIVVGAATAIFLAVAVSRNGNLSLPARFFALFPFEWVGRFSYSLYLIHSVLIEALYLILTKGHASPAVWTTAWIAIVPITTAAAYGLYLVAERPFMSSFLRTALDSSPRVDLAVKRESIAIP